MVRFYRISTLCLMLIFSTQTFALSIEAKLDSDKVSAGDTVKLTVTIDEQSGGKQPDFSPLKQQFDILSTVQSSQTNIINGRFTSRSSWILTLLPKRTGFVAIPPISYQGVSTRPVKLHVVKRDKNNPTEQLLFLDATIDKQDVYVQEQVIYTVRVFKSSIDIFDPSYRPPTIENSAMEQLGEQRNYKSTINGKVYDVFEFRYALFPQKSGTLTIPSAELTATVFNPRNRGMTFDPFNGKQVRRASPEVEINVKPKPSNYPADKPWLPARSLQLEESWSPDGAYAKLGEPVTRTITLKAEGLLSTILPEMPATEIDGVKIYPEQGDTSSSANDNGIISIRTESQALIATKTGTVELPAIDVTWWDVEEQTVKVTSLPTRSIRVTGNTSKPQTDTPTNQAANNNPSNDLTPPSLTVTNQTNTTWQWIAVTFLGLWLITLALLIWVVLSRNKQSAQTNEAKSALISKDQLKVARQTLEKACKSRDPKAARAALIAFFRQHWQDPSIKNLDHIAAKARHEPLQNALHNLDQQLYISPTEQTEDWNADFLLKAVDESLKRTPTNAKQENLEPLYPA
jgi:hypothetical protein